MNKKVNYNFVYKLIISSLLIIIFSFLLIRLLLPKQIDDVNPYINCEDNLLEESDIFYVIPLFQNKPINESEEWCEQILSMNKTLCLHGITHSYKEFDEKITKEELKQAIEVFEDCFGYKPTCFKPPQIAINRENIRLVNSFGMEIDTNLNQIFHKVYHCNDTGLLPNSLQKLL